jgi:uncharacterized protein YbjT (DUF2867 family)
MKIAVAGSTGLIGRQVTAIATEQGHEVVGLARETGFDLLSPDGISQALEGVDTLIDVTQSPTLEEQEATSFFETVAGNLGAAATSAGVRRTVVLSIVGADKSPDYGYYVAKVAQEEATRRSAPGPVVLRATQFHEFAGQMLEWNRDGGVTRIIDVPTQPVASAQIATLLVELATADSAVDTDLAGPQREDLVDQVRRLVALRGEELEVVAIAGPPSMAGGSMLPGPDAVIRGPKWEDWLATQPTAGR